MKEKILILNGSHSEISIIKAAQKLGFYVITTGSNPEGLGNSLSDEYVNIDYTNKEEILNYCLKNKILNIIPCANDLSIETFIFLKENIGLEYFDTSENLKLIHNKKKFKKLCQKLNIDVPNKYDKSSVKYPCIVKANDNCGGRGIRIVKDPTSLESAINYASKNSFDNEYLIEDFISSGLFSFSTLIKNQKVITYYEDREFTNLNPFSVTLSYHPSGNSSLILEKLISAINKIASYLKLTDGIFHIQYMIKDNRPLILEATRRMSGDLYALPVENAIQIPWSEIYIKSILGLVVKENVSQKRISYSGRICLLAPRNGKIKSINFSSKLRELILNKFEILKVGDTVQSHQTQRVAVLILDYKKEMSLEAIAQLENEYQIEVE